MVIKQTIIRGINSALKVILDLIKYIIPAVFVLKVLEHSGWLVRIADLFGPFMSYIGLPGEGALIIMMGQVTLYSAIAAMAVVDITVKQLTIVSTFVTIFHSFILETAVINKAGGNGFMIIGIRVIAAVLVCFILNILIPGV